MYIPCVALNIMNTKRYSFFKRFLKKFDVSILRFKDFHLNLYKDLQSLISLLLVLGWLFAYPLTQTLISMRGPQI